MLKYLLILSVLSTTAFSQENKIPPDVSKKMYLGALISDYGLSNDSKFSSYFDTKISPIVSSSYSQTYSNIRAYQQEKGKLFLSAKKIYGAFRNMLSTEEVLIILNLAVHEKEEQDFINMLSQSYVSRMDNVLFINDSIDNSSLANSKPLRFDISRPIQIGKDLEVSFTSGTGSSIEISSNHRKYTDIFKHCFRQIVKNYKISDYKVEVKWKRVEGEDFFLRTPLEIYMILINSGQKLNATYFGDFSHTGKTRSWGLIRENFKHFKESGNAVAYIPAEDFRNLKEISLLQGKLNVINNQFIGVQSLRDITETAGKELNGKAIALYLDIMGQIRSGQLKGTQIISAMDQVLKIQPNHLSAKIYKELVQQKYLTKMSLMNSFFEFEILFNEFKREGFFTDKKQPVGGVLNDMEQETKALYRVADKNIMTLCKSLLDIIKTVKSFEKATNASIQNGVKQKYFKNLRTINYQRDLLIDNQAAIDRIYKK